MLPLWLFTVASIGIGYWLIEYGKMTGRRERVRSQLVAISLFGGNGGAIFLGFLALRQSSQGLDGVGWWLAAVFYTLFIVDRSRSQDMHFG